MAEKNIFWNWFLDNQDELSKLVNLEIECQAMHLYMLNLHLKNYCPALDLILVFSKDDKNPKLIITFEDVALLDTAQEFLDRKIKPVKWTIAFQHINKIPSPGFAIIQEPTVKDRFTNIRFHNPLNETHLMVNFKNATMYYNYKHEHSYFSE